MGSSPQVVLLMADSTLAWTSCSDASRAGGDGLGEVCTPLTTATQIQQLCYCRAGENRLCHSKESRRPPAAVMVTGFVLTQGFAIY